MIHNGKVFLVKVLLVALILIFSLQSISMTDDIKELQIEGIGVGDSLLEYFNKEEIEKEKMSKYSLWYKNKKYVQIGVGGGSPLYRQLNNYDDMSLVLKSGDDTYKLYMVAGRIFCENISTCKKQQKEIVKELKIFFDGKASINIDNRNHSADPSGESKSYRTEFLFEDGISYVEVSVYDWSEKMEFPDNLKVAIVTKQFSEFLSNEAYE